MPTPATIKFDFSHYSLPENSLGIYELPKGQCVDNNFILSVVCSNLIPGNRYEISYQLLNPGSNPGNKINVFNPAIESIYASFATQTFATLTDFDVSGEYILQATIYDQSNGYRSSAIATLKCGDPNVVPPAPSPTPTVTPSRFSRQNLTTVQILDPGYNIIDDDIIQIPSGVAEFPLVALVKDTIIGYRYSYEFFETPANSITFEKKSGQFYAGSKVQNFNSKISFTSNNQYSYVYAAVTDSESNITKYSQPVLFQVVSGSLADVVLPSGINLAVGAPSYKSCALRGLTNNSITSINGGSGFSIGDKLSPEGGGGTGAEIQIISGGITADSFSSFSGGTGYNIGDYIEVTGGGGTGGLIQITSGGITKESINLASISNCTGFSVGDLLTTTGGGGQDAVILVTAVGTGGVITDIDVLNPGYGYTYAPNGLVSLKGSGSCTNVSFNADNFTITAAGGISSSSIKLQGGSGYNIGDVLNILGGGGSGAQVEIISGSLSEASINSLTGGSNYTVGDLLTTTGGGGSDVVIRVTSVDPGTGAITGWEILNGGYGFTSAPTGLSVLSCSSGNCTSASISANANNFAITPPDGITKSSISNLINTGSGYEVGDKIVMLGGGGSGAVIQITSVDNTGKILDFAVISSGLGYTGTPVAVDQDGITLASQPIFNSNSFTSPSYVVIDAGSGYIDSPTQLIASTGDGSGALASYTINSFTDPCFTVVNSGSGYTSAPTGLKVITGDGSGATATFNANSFTIPAAGGITPESINLSGGTGYNIGETLNIDGGGGTGAQVKVISGSLTTSSISSLTGGVSYSIGDYLTTTGGGGSDAIIKVLSVDGNGGILTWEIVNGGYGFISAPTGLVSLTGSGGGASLVANANNFALTESGGITNDSLTNLIGSNTGLEVGQVLNVVGGGGSGGQILITGVDNTGAITSYIILNSGSGYESTPTVKTLSGSSLADQPSWDTEAFTDKSYVITNSGSGYSTEPTSLTSANGNGTGGTISSDPTLFSKLAVNVVNPGSGYVDSPTGVSILTGYGNISNLSVSFNDKNFVEITGPAPSPSPTPTLTPTPSQSAPVPCNDLQSAGGQNDMYKINIAIEAPSGQNYLVASNVPDTNLVHGVLKGLNIYGDTSVTLVENYYRSINDTAGLKKIMLSHAVTGIVPIDTELSLYTTDVRLIKTAYWPGTMTFYYDAYSVPDRFKVIGIPVDSTKPEVLLYDSGFRGSEPCGYAQVISGIGKGEYVIQKPDGIIYIKVIVEAPCEGTAWKYLLSCPIRDDNLISPTPTRTQTVTPTLTPTPTSSPTTPLNEGP